MCDNAAKTIRSNYLKHIARPLCGTKKTCGSGLAHEEGVSVGHIY
ncbi:UNVERIFIED_ORG: hypothetical protein J2Y84_004452 [Pseudomonas reinekei]|nr:hypothetical protein [Pseudomonas reinekei]